MLVCDCRYSRVAWWGPLQWQLLACRSTLRSTSAALSKVQPFLQKASATTFSIEVRNYTKWGVDSCALWSEATWACRRSCANSNDVGLRIAVADAQAFWFWAASIFLPSRSRNCPNCWNGEVVCDRHGKGMRSTGPFLSWSFKSMLQKLHACPCVLWQPSAARTRKRCYSWRRLPLPTSTTTASGCTLIYVHGVQDASTRILQPRHMHIQSVAALLFPASIWTDAVATILWDLSLSFCLTWSTTKLAYSAPLTTFFSSFPCWAAQAQPFSIIWLSCTQVYMHDMHGVTWRKNLWNLHACMHACMSKFWGKHSSHL